MIKIEINYIKPKFKFTFNPAVRSFFLNSDSLSLIFSIYKGKVDGLNDYKMQNQILLLV